MFTTFCNLVFRNVSMNLSIDDASYHFQATVHGVCPTDFSVNAREDIATDVTVSRDLSKCDSFTARKQTTSPMAIITGMVGDLETTSY